MYRVAICDRDNKDRDAVQKLLQRKIEEIGLECEIDVFDSTQALLDSPNLLEYATLILEADMPEISGIEAGIRARDVNKRVSIIFISEKKEFAFDAFKARPVGYLLKPIAAEELEQILEFVKKIVAYFEMDKVCIKSKEGLVSVFLDEVVLVENKLRKAKFILKDGREIVSISNRSTFEKGIMPIPLQRNFLQPHKSYFVNMDYVSVFRADGIIMVNEMRVPISREKMQESKKKYREYAIERRNW